MAASVNSKGIVINQFDSNSGIGAKLESNDTDSDRH